MYLIKVIDENNNPVDTVQFKNNLTIKGAAPYRNFNGLVGLTRCTSKKYKNQLVLCFFYPKHQELSYAEFISERDAYELCAKRNKLQVADELQINLIEEVEVL